MKQRQGTQRGRPYKYLIETPDRHGNVRLYYRPPGGRWVRLREKPGTAGFDAEYGRAVRSEAARTPTRTHTVKGLGNWFARQCRMAGLELGLSAHGIRKFGAERAFEQGASIADLQAIFGWSTLKNPELYTRKAKRAQLEESAMWRLERGKQNRY